MLQFIQAPVTYIIHLENEETVYPNFKSKRSIAESIKTDDRSFVAEIVKEIDTARQKRMPKNATSNRLPRNGIDQLQGPKDIHLKANLRYHHQQRHPNGSVSGSYAQVDPGSNQLKVMHYVNDDRGFRWVIGGNKPMDKSDRRLFPVSSLVSLEKYSKFQVTCMSSTYTVVHPR